MTLYKMIPSNYLGIYKDYLVDFSPKKSPLEEMNNGNESMTINSMERPLDLKLQPHKRLSFFEVNLWMKEDTNYSRNVGRNHE